MKATFKFEKETKNTIRFQEVVEKDATPIIGPLYVQKSALEALKYEEGKELVIELSVN